jgi:hypothetical protein
MLSVATPLDTDPVPIDTPASLNVTVPPGVRLPTSDGISVAVRTTCCPNAGVVVLALRSVDVVTFVDASDNVAKLPEKLVSPPYDASTV